MHVPSLFGPRDRRASALLRASSILTVLGLAASLAACSGDQTGAAMAMAGRPVPVAVSTLVTEPVTVTQELPGRTVAFKVAEIRPQVTGIVTKRLFEEGSMVKAGQQLYQIDDATYQAALQRAKAELQRAEAAARVAKARMERLSGLTQSQAVSKQDYEDAQATYEQANASIASARAAVRQAEIDLKYTKVFSPISGRIGVSKITEGALVTANQAEALTRITQLDPIYVDMPQSSTDYLRLQAELQSGGKQPVKLAIEGLEGIYAHTGYLQSSDVTVDESTGAVRLRALFPNPDHRLLPGLFVRAQISLGERPAVLVPQRAATRTPQGSLQVWTVDADNTARPVQLESSGVYGDSWLVTGGVGEGDTIVMEGYQKLAPGATVQPSPWEATANRTSSAGEAALTAR